jgi:hypothetical protein
MKIKSLIIATLLLVSNIAFSQKQKIENLGNDDPNQAAFSFEKEEHNFGNITQGESVTYEFKFTNTGNEPLIISKAEGSCGCTVPVFPKEPILKNQTGIIKVTFNSTGKFGIQDKTVTLTSNAKQNPMVLHIKGNVDKAAEPATGAEKK